MNKNSTEAQKEGVVTVRPPAGDQEKVRHALSEELRNFEKSGACFACIDLSQQTILMSSAIGLVARLANIARQRGGKVIIFAPSDATKETLEVVRLNEVATILQDGDEFQAACTEQTKQQGKPARQAKRPQREQRAMGVSNANPAPHKGSFVLGPKMCVGLTVVSVLAVLLCIFFGATVFLQRQSIQRLSRTSGAVNKIMQIRIDSLSAALTTCKEEMALMDELYGVPSTSSSQGGEP